MMSQFLICVAIFVADTMPDVIAENDQIIKNPMAAKEVSREPLTQNDLDRMLSAGFLICSAGGASAGAFIKIGVFPSRIKDPITRTQQLATEYFCALFSGFVFTPLAMFWVPIMPVHPMSALSFSAAVAICSTLIVHTIFKRVSTKIGGVL